MFPFFFMRAHYFHKPRLEWKCRGWGMGAWFGEIGAGLECSQKCEVLVKFNQLLKFRHVNHCLS